MNTRTKPFLAATCGALLLAFHGCKCDCPPNSDSAPAPQAAALATTPTCVNGDLGERSKLYDGASLENATEAFKNHFAVQIESNRVEVKDPVVLLDVGKLNSLRESLKPKPVAIKVHYGLNADAFFPVFEFMKLAANGASAEPMGTHYVAVNGELKRADVAGYLSSKLMDDYFKNIRILRTDAHSWDTLTTDSTAADPLAEWFRFDLELSKLFADNPGGTKREVAISCISEFTCYSSIVGFVDSTPEEEYRHMLAWHVVIDDTAQLEEVSLNVPRPLDNIYLKRAVDLGHLCPPRCK